MTKTLTERETIYPALRERLEKLLAQRTAAQHHKQRAAIVLAFERGHSKDSVAREQNIMVLTVRKWVRRFAQQIDILQELEQDCTVTESAKMRTLQNVFEDAPRLGAPATFSSEQVAQILALAQSKPTESGLEVSH